LTQESLAEGHATFAQYRSAVLCGPDADFYRLGMCRPTGLEIVPGAIAACIEQGMSFEDEIVHAVSRVSRWKRSTVLSVLIGLSGDDPSLNPWSKVSENHYRNSPTISASHFGTLLAA